MSLLERARSSSLSAKILFGLGLGILTGLFLGDYASALNPLGEIYIRLMQMTVLPYLITSLIIAFGNLSMADAKRLAVRGGIALLLVWGVTSFVLIAVACTFPFVENAAFYSSSLVEARRPFSLTDIYFTANPFESLSRNIVPAVVIFSSLVGIALIGMTDKHKLLEPLEIWNQAIVRITLFVIRLTPVGVFGISAVAAGTIDPTLLSQLEIYFMAFGAAALVLAFGVLPLLVTAVTPFRYREVTGACRDAMLTAFVANSAFIVLPLLVERSKGLMERHGLLDDNSDSAAEVMVPVMFNFPNAGKLLTLLFVPFAAWLSGLPFPPGDYPALLATGIPSYFAKAQVALPFLLDLFGLPHDTFNLYIPTTLVTGRFDSMVTAMNLLVFALLGGAAMGGFLRLRGRRILLSLASMAGVGLAVVVALHLAFAALFDFDYRKDEALERMHQARPVVETIVHRDLRSVTALDRDSTASRLASVRARGSLRIGYDPDNLPMSFFNREGELVGFDVEIAQHLALALGLQAEFVPIRWPALPAMLSDGLVDVMPGMWYRPYWFNFMHLSEPYLIGTVGIAVLDQRRDEFSTLERIRRHSDLVIGIPLDASQIPVSMEHYFAGVDVEFVTLEFWRAFFEGDYPEFDGFLLPVEHASAWTLLHPEYTVVAPQPDPVRIPTGFGLVPGEGELREEVNEWIVYARSVGIIDNAYHYWIEGQGAQVSSRRWSILRDVLHWVE